METQVNESQYPNRRRPWTAVFLSLIMPGMGQIYCGDIKSGIAVTSALTVFSVVWVVGILHKDTPILSFSLMIFGVGFLASVFVAIDAYRRACRTRYDYQLKDYNHWAIYLMLVWCAGMGSIEYMLLFRKAMAEAFIIGSNSMAPTIMGGDRMIADKTAYDNTEPKRGDIVLFKNPQNRKQRFVQRIIALGGDTVEGKNGQLWINGRPLVHEWVKTITIAMPRIDIPREKQQNVKGDVFYEINNEVRYQVLIEKASPETANNTADFGPVAVPPYHCFLMGDNRSLAYDSRWFGPISLGAIQGKFRYLYWPRKDWSRFGKVE